MLQGFEPIAMRALLLERSDQPLHHPVQRCSVRRDELLAQSVAAYQRCVAAAREDQAVVRANEEGRRDSSRSAKACGQGLLQSGSYDPGSTAARQMPPQQLSVVTVHRNPMPPGST